MRILYSHRTRSADGQYVHIRSLTQALKMRGHDLEICGPGDQAAAPKKMDAEVEKSSDAKSFSLPKPLYEVAEFGYSAVGWNKLRAAATRMSPDILYERYNLFYHAGVRLAKARRLPLIMEVNAPLVDERSKHGGLALKSFARWSENSLWRAADAVLPVTNVLADVVAKAGVPRDKITVIQNGVDDTFLSEVDPRDIRQKYNLEGKLVLGFTGFVRDWHGVDRVLNFIAQSGRKDLHLLLVGDGTVRAELEVQARELGISDQFTVCGVVQRDEVPSYVAAFDIALQPAVVAYASPLKMFEYMALGKPIIAPASPNICEVLTDGEDAILFDENDPKGFHDAMTRAVDDLALRERLAGSARKSLLRQDLTWAQNAVRVENIAKQLLEKPYDASH